MKISVCMTTYNGSQYVEKQVLSILPQLGKNDELVIVDDCSTDQTAEVIKKIEDSRIKFFQNSNTLGINKNFEKSILYSQGDIIFLSDQDDIWMPDKIQEITNIFIQGKKITLVLSNIEVIDKYDNIVPDSKLISVFIPGIISNIIRPRFRGCTLAFRKKMIKHFLPFPENIPMYDMWIGLVNEIYGKIFYINKPLIKYRIHDNNVTSDHRYASILQIVRWRYTLIKSLLMLIFKNNHLTYQILRK